MKKIEFVDAQQMKAMHPGTFEAPDTEDFGQLKVGDYVKVCAFSERFWTEVTAVDGNNITARVDNLLIMTKKIGYNDTISFETRHIYDILKKEEMEPKNREEVEKMKQRAATKIRSQGKGHRRL